MPDEGPKRSAGPVRPLIILMMIGAIIGMLSVFFAWFTVEFLIFRISYAGHDFLLRSFDYPDPFRGVGYYAYVPFVIVAGSALAFFSLMFSLQSGSKKGAIFALVLGAVMLVSAVLYSTYPKSLMMFTSADANLVTEIRLMDHLDIGFYLAVIGSIILIVGGVIILLYTKTHREVQDIK